jgi:hypothetical protein
MVGSRYFVILFLLIVFFEPITLPFPLRGEGLGEGQIEFQAQQKETPPKDPVRNSSGTSNPTEITPGPDSASEQRATISNGVNIEERWGIRIQNVRLSANGYLLDFRYRVINPEKALPLIGQHAKPCIIDEASGMKLSVPNMPKVGSLRAKGNKPDRDYFILFSNPNRIVKKGNKVTIIVDGFKTEHLIVE